MPCLLTGLLGLIWAFPVQALEPISVQLQWRHQFEFAGFYAAKAQGYYADAGLDVMLKEARPGMDLIDEVLSGRSHFGTYYSTIVAERMAGKPLRLLANYFKRSPLVLVTQPEIHSPGELAGGTIMADSREMFNANFGQMFERAGIAPDSLKLEPHSFELSLFRQRQVAAMTAFSTNEVYELNRRGIPYRVFDPNDYGVALYDVNLYTSAQLAQARPELVERFTEATNRGWAYALAHVDETIELIKRDYDSQGKSRDHLRFEAEATRNVILPEVYIIGSVDKAHLSRIQDLFLAAGLGAKRVPLDEFLHLPTAADDATADPSAKQPWDPRLGLSLEEQEFLASHPLVEIGIGDDLVAGPRRSETARQIAARRTLKRLASLLGIRFKLVPGARESIFRQLQEHTLDGMADVPSDVNSGLLITHPYHSLTQAVIVPEGNPLGIRSDEDLRGRRLAVRRGDPLVFTSIQGLADIHWGERHACAELSQAVLHGKADAMLCDMDSLDRELDLRRAGLELAYQRLEPLNLHFVLRDDWPELKSAINKALALFSVHDRLLINNDNASLAVSDASFPELSAEEQAFIDGKSRRLTYCHCQGRPPLDALRGGLHQGINRDFLTLFGRKLGVQFIPLPSVDNLNAMERAARGECDLLIGAEPRVHGVQGLVFTSPYRSSVQVLLGLKERDFVGSLSVLDERSIGVPSKSRITETLSARFPTMRLVPYDGSEDMAKAIRQRRVHAAVAPLEQAAELVDSNAGEFRIIGTLEQSFDMAMATRVDQLLLHGILQKAVVSISAAERDAIHGRRTRFTVEQGVDFTELWQLLGVALLILTLLAYRQYGLARLNRRLMQARDAAESANAAKTLAVASISHDLRTPVNAILGHAHVIYANPAKARESSAVIQESARHMASLLNDLLDLSKLEEGHVELTPEPIELIPFIRGVASLCRENAKARGLKLNLRLVEPLPRVVELDQTRLRQVLVNLLSNAIKYTDQGSVTLGVMSLSQAKPGEHRIRFQVDDTGPGIPEDQREKIFDTFARGDLAREGGEGSGLGLSISKGLVALMGDRLWVLSQVGKGSHFGFELNLPTRHAAVAGVARQPETPGSVTPHTETLRVLVVDDSRINREVTQELLRLFSIEVELAESASQALKLARASRFDLVLMDIEMPGMDGIGLMDRLRDENLIPGVPVIAMTAHAGEAHRQRFLAAGMNDHLPKPVEPEAMKAIVERWTGRTLRMESVDMENATDLPQLEHVNTEAGLRHWGGNASDYLNALIEASVIVAGWSAAIRQEAEAEQRQSLAKRAHRILGMAAYLGAEDLERAARVLGEDLEAKASGSTWFTSAKALADSLDQLLISLEALPEQEEPTASGDRQSLLKELLGCLEAGDFESDLVAQKLSRISKAGADAGIQHIVELVKVFKYDEAAQAVRQLLP